VLLIVQRGLRIANPYMAGLHRKWWSGWCDGRRMQNLPFPVSDHDYRAATLGKLSQAPLARRFTDALPVSRRY